jgi:ABC-type xylose transport system permease subunit
MVIADLPRNASLALIFGSLALAAAMILRDAARRRRYGLDAAPRAIVVLKLAALGAAAGLLAFVFGQRGLPVPVLVAGATVALGVLVTRRTRFGRHLYAIGGNPEAARLAGISVERVTIIVFVILGVLTAIAGLLLAGRTNGVTPGNAGNLLELDVVTAVVIGGTSLLGGRGSILGSLLGALVFGTLANSMNLLEINSNWQLIVKGLILLSAVLIDVLTKRKRQ